MAASKNLATQILSQESPESCDITEKLNHLKVKDKINFWGKQFMKKDITGETIFYSLKPIVLLENKERRKTYK